LGNGLRATLIFSGFLTMARLIHYGCGDNALCTVNITLAIIYLKNKILKSFCEFPKANLCAELQEK